MRNDSPATRQAIPGSTAEPGHRRLARTCKRLAPTFRCQLEPLEGRTLLSATRVSYSAGVSDVALDSAGNVYTSGSFNQTADFDPGPGQTLLTAPTSPDWFLAKYTSSGALAWVKQPGFGFASVQTDAADHVYIAGGRSRIDAYGSDGSPLWSHSPALSTGAGAGIYGMATDATGIAVTGYLNGTAGSFIDFDPDHVRTDDTLALSTNTDIVYQDAFVAKWDYSGNFLWARSIGGPDTQQATGLASDGTNLYASGNFRGSILQAPFTMTNTTSSPSDSYVVKLDPNGTILGSAQFVDLVVEEVAADTSGVYAVGESSGQGFAERLTSDLSLTWSRQVGGGEVNGVSLSGGQVLITGGFHGTADFDPGPGQSNLTAAGYSDIFVLDLAAADGSFGWARNMGGPNTAAFAQPFGDSGFGIAANANGVYTVGQFSSGAADFDPSSTGTAILTNGIDGHGFVSTLTPAGNYAGAFQVGGTVATVDDGDAGYSQIGSNWKAATGGYGKDNRTARAGTGTNTATWTTTGLPAGSYDVLATWVAGSKNATNAQYTVNGVAAPLVNQSVAPGDFQFTPDNSLWKRLGTIVVSDGGQITVVLSDKANGTVDADAIRVVTTGSTALHASSIATAPVPPSLTTAQVRPVLAQALAYWRAHGAETSHLGHIDIAIADLGGDRLGQASGSTITLDDNADGWGWNVGRAAGLGRKALSGRMDLLSALTHEVGHLLGHNHAEGGIMAESLAPGVRQALPVTASHGHAPTITDRGAVPSRIGAPSARSHTGRLRTASRK